MRIAIACGGTGGHLYPGLATARLLQAHGHSVTLWMSGRTIEEAVMLEWDGPVVTVAARGFAETFGMSTLVNGLRLGRACLSACRKMYRNRPDVVLGMGSYASVAAVVAAALWRVPIVLHEANAVPGRAIDLLSRFADEIALAFPQAGSLLKAKQSTVTGLPLRSTVLPQGGMGEFAGRPFHLLVMGGSQGARRLNEQASLGICLLHQKGMRFPVTHLCGDADLVRTKERYREAGVDAQVHGFLVDMRRAYRAGKCAIARSGAASVMELAAWGIPTLFIPLPEARRNHQVANAGALRDAGAASMLRQSEMNASSVADCVETFFTNADRLTKMHDALSDFAVTDGAEKLARLVEHAGSRSGVKGRS